jgi:hypothetical protein
MELDEGEALAGSADLHNDRIAALAAYWTAMAGLFAYQVELPHFLRREHTVVDAHVVEADKCGLKGGLSHLDRRTA